MSESANPASAKAPLTGEAQPTAAGTATADPALDANSPTLGMAEGSAGTQAAPSGAADPWQGWLDMDRFDVSGAVELVDKGGPVVVILLAISVVALAVVLLKAVQFVWWGVGRDSRLNRAMELYETKGYEAADAVLKVRPTPAATVVRHALSGLINRYSEPVVREDAERLAGNILTRLRTGLRVLEAASQVAPLLGLFGTVIGMIGAFQTLQTAGAEADPGLLAGGIWVALLTTAVGLAVAIPAALALYWFEGRIEREVAAMENALTRIFTGGLRAPSGTYAAPGIAATQTELANAAE